MSRRVHSNDTIVWYKIKTYQDYRKHDMPYYNWIGHMVISKKFSVVMGGDNTINELESVIHNKSQSHRFFRNGGSMIFIKKK